MMAEQVGILLWEWRTAAGWSLGQLARRAGVSKAALSQWEAGQRQPRVPELEATLDALGVSAAQRARILACLEAPRAIRHLKAASDLPPIGPLPSVGNLLRAMRLRAGWTQARLGRHLGVGQNTVARWEQGERLPSTEQMQALCFALSAHEEELVALTTGRFSQSSEETPAESQALHDALLELLYDPRAQLVDLRYLLIERGLWQQAVQEERALPLLAQVYAEHAHYLSLHARWEEVKALAQRALALTPHASPPPSYALRAVLKLAAAEVYGGHRLAPEYGFHRLKAWSSRSCDTDFTAWMLSDMGKYLVMAGHKEAALELGKKAMDITRREQEMRHLDYGRLLLLAGYPEKALEHLSTLNEQARGMYIYEVLTRCEAYLNLGERDAAWTCLERAYAMIEVEGSIYDRSQADALAQRF